jgi:uncharacterized protein YggE
MRVVWKVLPLALAGALILSACAGVAGGAQGAPQRLITVTGTGTARLTPDIVIITLGVQTQGPDIAEAVSENNQRADQVRQAIREAGVADEDVQTVNFSVWTQQQYDSSGIVIGQVTYWVDNTLQVKLRDLGRLGEFLQTALSRGANSVQGVTYSVEDPTEALDTARVHALEDAHAQAAQIAADAGVVLGEVVSIGEPGATPGPVYEAPAAMGMGGGGSGQVVPTSPGTLEYDIQVSVSYAIQ